MNSAATIQQTFEGRARPIQDYVHCLNQWRRTNEAACKQSFLIIRGFPTELTWQLCLVWDILTFCSAKFLWNLIKSKLPQWLRGLRSSMKTTTVVSQSMERFIWFSLAVLYKYYFIPKLKLFLQSVVVVVLSRITLRNNIWLDLLGFLSSLWSEDARCDLLAPPWSWSSPPR